MRAQKTSENGRPCPARARLVGGACEALAAPRPEVVDAARVDVVGQRHAATRRRACSTSQSNSGCPAGSSSCHSGCHCTPIASGGLHRLDGAVGRAGADREPVADAVERLVVGRRDLERRAGEARDARARLRGHRVVGRGRVVVVAELVLDVPVERPAVRDVEQLDAAADRQDRQPALARRLQQAQLPAIALGVEPRRPLVRRAVVEVGADVLAAGQHEPVERLRLQGRVVGARPRQHQRHPAGAQHGLHQALVDRVAGVLAHDAADGARDRRDAHERRHRTRV